MQYLSELSFFMKLFKNSHIPCRILQDPMTELAFNSYPDLDLGIRGLINPGMNYREHQQQFFQSCSPNTIYRVNDEFMCRYLFFQMPETDTPTYILIGPYTATAISRHTILEYADRYSIPPDIYPFLEKFYQDLPIVPDESSLLILINTFGEVIWGSLDNFSLQDVEKSVFFDLEPVAERPDTKEPEEAFLSMKILDERYAMENRLMQAVSQGQTHKAEMYLNTFTISHCERRTADPIRNLKNYMIILNTLLRKAAEAGAVHPLHIDSLSSKFARKIELVTSESAASSLQREMVHKYCLLVKNHSMKGYSLLIRKVLTRIDSDLTADLGLKKQAQLLNVNPSYLSTLFKKETGTTLTEYVNRKRIEHGIFLLNSTNMQIQTIAQYCGMPDVNYFAKTFKKIIGKTPKEYRDSISNLSLTH